MDTNVKNLVAQLPAIIANYTQRSHVDVEIQVIYLLKYVKKANASKTNMLYQLEEIEHLLSKKYGERNPNISKHFKQIRQGLDVKMQGMAGTVPSIGNKRNPHNMNQMLGNIICGEGSRCIAVGGRQRQRPRTSIICGKASSSIPVGDWQRTRPRTRADPDINKLRGTETTPVILAPNTKATTEQGQRVEKRLIGSATTQFQASKQDLDTNIHDAEEKELMYHGGNTDEVHFIEQCMILLKEMINDDTQDPVETIIHPPKKNIKEKVKTSYIYILDVAKEIRRTNVENQYLRKILDDLYTNLLGREETSEKEIKSKDIQNDQSNLELETKVQRVIWKFHETGTELDSIYTRVSQLISTTVGDGVYKEQKRIDDRYNKNNVTWPNPKRNPASTNSTSEKFLKLDKDLELFSLAWAAMKEHEREAEHASQLLEEFNKLCLDNFHLETELDRSKQPKQGLSGVCRNGIKEQKGDETNKKTPISIHFEQIKRNIASATNILKKHIDMVNTVQERNYFMSMLEILLQNVQELYEGKTEGDIPSSLDQIESSIDQESSVYLGLTYVREISAIHMKWKSASEKLKREREYLLSIVDALHHDTQYISEGKSHNVKSSVLDHLASSIDKDNPAYHMFKKAREVSSIQMEWKREAEYAVQLLERLSKHSSDDGKQDTEFIIRQPPTPMTSDISKDRKVNKKGNTMNEEPPCSRHIAQLQKSFASASNILMKQMEGKYAARLLEELGSFSNEAERDRTGTGLTDPPTESLHSVDAKNIEGRNTSGTNTQPFVHSDKCSIHYANASHILEQMKEKDDLRAELVRNAKRLENLMKTHEHLTEQNSQLVHQVDSLRTRLSELAGAKLTHDNASIADLSDPNRPTKLAEMYSELYDNQWTDAFENLSKRNPGECDETLICCLYNILIDGYQFCQQIRDEQKSTLEKILFDPAKYMVDGEARQTNKVNEVLAKHLSEAAKLSSNVASANIVKAFVSNENMKKRNRKALKACKIFIEECVTLCWHMQVQTPPVWIDFRAAKGQAFARDVYREYTTKGPKIAFVVWPPLFLHKTGPMLLKGVAQGE